MFTKTGGQMKILQALHFNFVNVIMSLKIPHLLKLVKENL